MKKTTFIASITTKGEVKLVFPEGNLKTIDSEDNIKDYISGTILPTDTYTIYGDGITSIQFVNDNFVDIHIERNDEQTNADNICKNLFSLKTFTALETTFSNVTSFRYSWAYCKVIGMFPKIDTSKAITLLGTWRNNESLKGFPLLDTRNVISLSKAWMGCKELLGFPAIDTSSVINMYSAWAECLNMLSFPYIDISKVTNITYAWFKTYKLICMGGFSSNNERLDGMLTFPKDAVLLRPNTTEQAAILAGKGWTNDTPC